MQHLTEELQYMINRYSLGDYNYSPGLLQEDSTMVRIRNAILWATYYVFTPNHSFRIPLNSPKLPSFWENGVAVYMGSVLLLTFHCWQSLSQHIMFSSLNSSPGQRQEGNKWHVHSRQKFLTAFGGWWQPENTRKPKKWPSTLDQKSPFPFIFSFPRSLSPGRERSWIGRNHNKAMEASRSSFCSQPTWNHLERTLWNVICTSDEHISRTLKLRVKGLATLRGALAPAQPVPCTPSWADTIGPQRFRGHTTASGNSRAVGTLVMSLPRWEGNRLERWEENIFEDPSQCSPTL